MRARKPAILTLALCFGAAACSRDPSPTSHKLTSSDVGEAAVPSETGAGAATHKTPADLVVTNVPAPAATGAPVAREIRDSKGRDWASHVGDVAFTFDSGEAATRAKKEGRLQMLYFTTPTADASKTLARTAFRDPRVVEKARSFVSVLVNADVEQDLTGRYGVVSMPTIVYVAPGGKSLAVTTGVVTADEVLADMDAAIDALARKDDERK